MEAEYRYEKIIVDIGWLVECLAQKQLVVLTKRHLVEWISSITDDDPDECVS